MEKFVHIATAQEFLNKTALLQELKEKCSVQ
jgi:hypothetical protein